MRFMKMIVAAGFISLLATSPAFAFGGGGGSDEAAASSGSSVSSGSVSAADTAGPVAITSEPLALLAVGLGLLGARFLRRR